MDDHPEAALPNSYLFETWMTSLNRETGRLEVISEGRWRLARWNSLSIATRAASLAIRPTCICSTPERADVTYELDIFISLSQK